MSRSMRRGEPYTPDTLTRMWHKLGNAAGVRPIRLHDARHSCGTALHLRGVPLAVIAMWLGHADASITGRLYTYSQGEALRDAGNSLGGVFPSSEGTLLIDYQWQTMTGVERAAARRAGSPS
jgi:integrase